MTPNESHQRDLKLLEQAMPLDNVEPGAMDEQTAALHDVWLAFGDLIDQADVGNRADARRRIEPWHGKESRRTWRRWGAVVLAAAASLVLVAGLWQWASRAEVARRAIENGPSTRPPVIGLRLVS